MLLAAGGLQMFSSCYLDWCSRSQLYPLISLCHLTESSSVEMLLSSNETILVHRPHLTTMALVLLCMLVPTKEANIGVMSGV